MEEMTDRFINDPDFREQMRQDPEGTAERFAAERFGVQLDEEDRQALRMIDWSIPDEQLQERVSKDNSCRCTYCSELC